MTKFVYLFNEGNAEMKNLLGGKGANLAEMTNLGLPIPQGFTVTTEACTRYYDDGEKLSDDITEEMINSRVDTWELPDPDLILRTSGEQRLSNFLLWQAAYSEFYYTDCHWPDFNEEELEKAIEWYNRRDRRYGAVKCNIFQKL